MWSSSLRLLLLLTVGYASGAVSTKPCYSPIQKGCDQCCREVGAFTEIYRWSSDPANGEPADPWYNSVRVERNKKCPSNMRPCAECTQREQNHYQVLLANGPPAGCVCDNLERYLDPCFLPKSCRCYCASKRRLGDCKKR